MCSHLPSKLLFILLRIGIFCLLVQTTTQNEQNNALLYLSQYGYLPPQSKNPTSEHLMDEESFKSAIRDFQSFAGLNVTGELDKYTLETMKLPRCGVKDRVGPSSRRSKRYALQGSRWRVKNLTYKISKYPKRLTKEKVDLEVKKAFSVWSDVTPLTFTAKTSGAVHIEVKFVKGEHGDGDPFDGPGGTLAHAYFPVYGGDAHFDDSEQWTIDSYSGTNLFQVAAHEFGHSLGLGHSEVRSALMAAFYRGYEQSFILNQDDVSAIQALYGRKVDTGTSTTAKPDVFPPEEQPEEDAELCNDAAIDTIFNSAEGTTYAFKGAHYWKLTKDAIAPGYPRLIKNSWPGLPGNMDAAFTYKNGKTYFFKGSQYWRYTGKKVDGAYPKLISEGFTGIPNNIDAAMVWGGNGKIYFFKGTKFWKFDPSQRPPVKSTYPKEISNWEGLPNNLDAALQYTNGYTYFFKKGKYYRFNDRTFAVDEADPPFPRPAGYWWFGCRSETSGGNAGELKKLGQDDDIDFEDTRRQWPSDTFSTLHRDGDVSDLMLDGDDPQRRTDEKINFNENNSGERTTAALFVVLCAVLVSL